MFCHILSVVSGMASLRNACEQWKDGMSSALLSWSSPFQCGAHISNFVHILEEKTGPRQEPARFLFGLPFSLERWTKLAKVSDLEALWRRNLSSQTFEQFGQLNLEPKEARIQQAHLHEALGEAQYLQNLSVSLTERQENQSTGTAPVSKEELGRATWTFLHTLAAHFPDKPTRQQQKDAKELMAIISRLYPCKECADHFSEILKTNPVQAGSGLELSHWMCKVHNIVNRSLQKPVFPCQRVDARWGALDCDNDACNLQGRFHL